MARRDDLVAKLRQKIAEAMARIRDMNAPELLMISVAASEAKANAVRWSDAILQTEAESLSAAVEHELEDRGGAKYLRTERLGAVNAMDEKAIRDADATDLIERIMQAKAIAVGTPDEEERLVMEKFVARARDELAKRGIQVEVLAREVGGLGAAAATVKTPPPVPSPSEIINGTSPPDVPKE